MVPYFFLKSAYLNTPLCNFLYFLPEVNTIFTYLLHYLVPRYYKNLDPPMLQFRRENVKSSVHCSHVQQIRTPHDQFVHCHNFPYFLKYRYPVNNIDNHKMKYILNMFIPLAIDRTNTIIDTRTRVKVSENTIIEGGQSARYQNNNKIS